MPCSWLEEKTILTRAYFYAIYVYLQEYINNKYKNNI